MLKPEDIAAIFEWIELLLIASLKRNLARHKEEEEQEGFTWSAWQAEKLRSVNIFRRQCSAIMDRYKEQIDDETRQLLEEQFEEGVNGAVKELEEAHTQAPQNTAAQTEKPQSEEQPSNEPETVEAPEPVTFQVTAAEVQQKSPSKPSSTAPEEHEPEITVEKIIEEMAPEEPVVTATVTPEPQFFGVDKAKTEKLIENVTQLEEQVETAALRMTDDVYRQTVNRVQLAMATGSITYEKAVDMAVADFLAQGINCIEYSNGRRVNIADYVRMVLRTTSTRAALQGKSERFKASGYDTVQVSSYGMCSKTCLPWQGRVYINDAFMDWQGETKYEGDVKYGRSEYCGKWFPLLSSAIAEGLFHPNCKHGIGLYIDGSTKLPEPLDNSDIERRYKEEQHQRALEREVRKAKRKVEGSLDPADVKKAKADLREAEKNVSDYIDEVNKAEGDRVLVRKPIQEKIYGEAPPRIGSSADPYEPPKKPVQSTEGFAAEVNIPAPENQTVEYTEQKIPERLKSAGIEENKAVEPTAEVEAGNVNNQSIDNGTESGIIEETEETREFNPLPPEKVVPEMRKAFDSWLPSVSGEEYSSLVKYTKNVEKKGVKPFFERLNTALRDKVILSDRMKYHSDNISNAINKFNLLHDIVCYRATKKNFFDKYSVGELFYADYFLSSSASRAGALKGKFLTIIRAPKGSRCAYIEKLSLYPSQREVLFDKSCQYRVVEKNDKYMVIEVINND